MNEKLFHKDFNIILFGQFISLMGNSIQRFALSLYILQLTGSAAMFSTIISLQILPIILLSPFGGAIADRMNKGKIMVVLDLVCGLLVGVFAFFFYGNSHQILSVAVLMVLLSVINSIYTPAVSASIPIITSGKHLNTANGLTSQINAMSNLAGPVVAGFLYGFVGLKPVLVVNMISFVVAGLMEMFLTIPFEKVQMSESAVVTYGRDIKESIGFLYHEKRIVLYIILIASTANLFLTPIYTVGAPYLEKVVFGVSDQMYGISEAVMGAGMIAGAILVTIITKFIPFEKIGTLFLLISVAVLGMGLCVTPWIMGESTPHMLSYWILTLSGFVIMFLLENVNIQAMTFIQKQVPDSIMGKTMALTMALSTVFMPIGQIVFGWLYDKMGSALPIIYLVVMMITIYYASGIQKMFRGKYATALHF